MKKNIAIVILLLLVLGLAGYVAYDKVVLKESSEPQKTENNETTTENGQKESSVETGEEITGEAQKDETVSINYINATYYGNSDDASNNYYPKECLILFSDGKYTRFFVDSEATSGTYEINGDKLVLHNSNVEGPSTGTITLDFMQDKTQVKDSNLILKKLN